MSISRPNRYYNEGYQAGKRDVPQKHNPYSGWKATEWRWGWYAGSSKK